jgi:hypothetical protein
VAGWSLVVCSGCCGDLAGVHLTRRSLMASTGAGVLPRVRPRPIRGATYNCLRGRNPDRVARWVRELMVHKNLSFVLLQEATDYVDVLRGLPGCVLVSPAGGHHETVIVVDTTTGVSNPDRVSLEPLGWSTVRGGRAWPRTMAVCRLDGWLVVGSVHFPPSVTWRAGRPRGPSERVKAYRRSSRTLTRWLSNRRRPVLVAGDFNEPADTAGRWSPRWIARTSGSHIWTTGGIDYAIGARVRVTGLHNVADRGGSDHHARVFTVHPPTDLEW